MSGARWTVGHDPAWGGWGWAIGTDKGPALAYYVALGSLKDRVGRLREYLHRVYGPALDHVVAKSEGPPRVFMEEAPEVYAGRAGYGFEKVLRRWQALTEKRARGRLSGAEVGELRKLDAQIKRGPSFGNQATICANYGKLYGAIELWSRRPDVDAPEGVPPKLWRSWWGIPVSGPRARREEVKARAYELVSRQWGRRLTVRVARYAGSELALDDVVFSALPRSKAEDVAESVLIQVGAAQVRPKLG